MGTLYQLDPILQTPGLAADRPVRITERAVKARQGAQQRLPITIVEDEPERMVFMGDVHGDITAFQDCLEVAGLIDEEGAWAGGTTVLVQLGDIFDRGDDDLAIEEWLFLLAEQAAEAGGAVYHLLGNHELMNIMGDHSSASKESFAPFVELSPLVETWMNENTALLEKVPKWAWPRLAAMRASGPVAHMMAGHSVAMKIGNTLVVHAGILREHLEPQRCGGVTNGGVACLELLNSVAANYLLNGGGMPQEMLWGRESPVWTRRYSMPDGKALAKDAEEELIAVLEATGSIRMVVGHTPQSAGINSAAQGKVWRVDTGMTKAIGGKPEVLEIRKGGEISILTKAGRVSAEQRSADTNKLTGWF
ncbi:calcineurin-like phosphoesterase family protein [Tribonema minus]|uniref:Calcineurin-like phosphoesterase family protein n=1 Tax=Tribonema minus TaxID=303371 RepID=A0A835Z833_9STRA|nr:calcineurin-like phosphoesterase family protein [Tribonema minus]